MEELYSDIQDIISYIKNSQEYKEVLLIREKMNKNSEVMFLISEVKRLQKKYVKSQFDVHVKEELDVVEEKLNQFPLYVLYIQNLSKVNEKISYVNDNLNEYFYQLLNKES